MLHRWSNRLVANVKSTTNQSNGVWGYITTICCRFVVQLVVHNKSTTNLICGVWALYNAAGYESDLGI